VQAILAYSARSGAPAPPEPGRTHGAPTVTGRSHKAGYGGRVASGAALGGGLSVNTGETVTECPAILLAPVGTFA
jgi:hypothetical protein